MVTPKYKYLAEQVSHHPPITAFHTQGTSGFKMWSNNYTTTKFTGKCLNLKNNYLSHFEFPMYEELFQA
jgi:hypothetical protein